MKLRSYNIRNCSVLLLKGSYRLTNRVNVCNTTLYFKVCALFYQTLRQCHTFKSKLFPDDIIVASRLPNRFTFTSISLFDKSISPRPRERRLPGPSSGYLSTDVSICNRKYLHLLCDSRVCITSGCRR